MSYSPYKYDFGRSGMPIDRTHLLQVRLSEEERRRIKTMAASQGMTLQQALTTAFAAWAKELRAGGRTSQPKRVARKKSAAAE